MISPSGPNFSACVHRFPVVSTLGEAICDHLLRYLASPACLCLLATPPTICLHLCTSPAWGNSSESIVPSGVRKLSAFGCWHITCSFVCTFCIVRSVFRKILLTFHWLLVSSFFLLQVASNTFRLAESRWIRWSEGCDMARWSARDRLFIAHWVVLILEYVMEVHWCVAALVTLCRVD